MELCAGGNLLDHIVSKQGHYSERGAAQLIRKVIGVVDGCHSLGVVHGNLKPEDLWFASSAEDAALKATDFEFSEFYMPGDKLSRISGSTTYYVAPEVLQKCYGPEADIWSVGVILYILLSGVPPFWAGEPFLAHCNHQIQSIVSISEFFSLFLALLVYASLRNRRGNQKRDSTRQN